VLLALGKARASGILLTIANPQIDHIVDAVALRCKLQHEAVVRSPRLEDLADVADRDEVDDDICGVSA
jgi:hypothetical protein